MGVGKESTPIPRARSTSGRSAFLENLNCLGNLSSVLQRTLIYTVARDHKIQEQLRHRLLEAGLENHSAGINFFLFFFLMGNVLWDSKEAQINFWSAEDIRNCIDIFIY